MNTKSLLAAGIALGFACNIVAAQAVSERNGILSDTRGHTLYTFDKDSTGRSACYGGCAAAWPPFVADDGAQASGRFGIVARDDGSRQWAVDGKPLYYFAADTQAGDVKGDGQGGVWHVVRQGPARKAASPQGYGGYSYGYGY